MSQITKNRQAYDLASTLLGGLLAISSINIANASASDNATSDNETQTSSRSISYSLADSTSTVEKQQQLAKAELQALLPISKQGYRSESTQLMSSSYYGDFSIYATSVELVEDFDYDGFYHHFSVTMDVDTVYSNAHVYAELYISYEGGPWNYYASTDVFTIYGDSASDAFVIESELVDGFPAGYYDIRIDLYDADQNTWLLSYGPYEDNSLSTLPLEDSYRDNFYDDTSVSYETDIYVHGNGAINGWSLLLLAGLALIARRLSGKVGNIIHRA